MRFGILKLAIPLATLAAFLALPATTETSPGRAVVHEWGTFTSIAGADGQAVEWMPLGGPSDLPCFVHRTNMPKGSLPGRIRMETPVLYFYAPFGASFDVNVGFKQGRITEWFPQAVRPPNGGSYIRWSNVKVAGPKASPLPVEAGKSHYYAARETEASPIQVDGATEKFLFYRGVADFAAPLSAVVQADGRVRVWNPSGAVLGDVILLENRGGATGYQIRRVSGSEITMDRPVIDDESNPLDETLERMLTARGLYPKEAKAMIETWKDSWFEEGSRIIYLVRPEFVESILPIGITPTPAEMARVFVGRIELLTPEAKNDLREGIAANDTTSLSKFGRFLPAFAQRLVADTPSAERPQLQQKVNVLSAWQTSVQDRCR